MPFLAEVTADHVNLRAGQNTNFESLGRLPQGTPLVVVDKSYTWYKVKLPTTAKSFVNSSLISMVREDVGQVTGNRVNVRAQPKADSTSLGQLKKETLVRVLEIVPGGWYRIEPVDETYGWVLMEYVTFRSQEIPPARIVELPSRNIYRRKKVAEKAPEKIVPSPVQSDVVLAQGVVEDLGQQAPSPEIRHRIKIDEQTIYFLKGYRSIIDGFLHNRVKIEGSVEANANSSYPVILVKKISLIL